MYIHPGPSAHTQSCAGQPSNTTCTCTRYEANYQVVSPPPPHSFSLCPSLPLSIYLGSSERAKLISFLHDIGLPLRECGIPPQFVLDVLHRYLYPASCLLPWSWFGLLLRFIIITTVVSSTLGVLRDLSMYVCIHVCVNTCA